MRSLYAANPDGTIGRYLPPKKARDAIFAGRQKPDYARIRVPVLAFFASAPSVESEVQRYKPQNADERAAVERKHAVDVAIKSRHMRDLQRGVPAARVIEVPGANYYIFLSSVPALLREMRAFMAVLR